jgi:hypothetical protein
MIPNHVIIRKKNIVLELATEYLQEAADLRGISRTKLALIVMERVISDRLVLSILKDNDARMVLAPVIKYRRFKPRKKRVDKVRKKFGGPRRINLKRGWNDAD